MREVRGIANAAAVGFTDFFSTKHRLMAFNSALKSIPVESDDFFEFFFDDMTKNIEKMHKNTIKIIYIDINDNISRFVKKKLGVHNSRHSSVHNSLEQPF